MELRLAGACDLVEANQVLAEFLPRFNQRFGVPADQPESAYRPVDPELELGSVLPRKDQGVAPSGQRQHGAIPWSHLATISQYRTTQLRWSPGGGAVTSGRSSAGTASEPDSNSPGSSGASQRTAGSDSCRSRDADTSRPGPHGLETQATRESSGDERAPGRGDYLV